jgi:hypothetical protein
VPATPVTNDLTPLLFQETPLSDSIGDNGPPRLTIPGGTGRAEELAAGRRAAAPE